ncbi:MAG: BMP family ABC transporter substrate-binding protein [Treponema sp.]|jgi:basic membrane protein A|nr:BMP family ABC transporter substrate-binding protein [Treponema sp.]
MMKRIVLFAMILAAALPLSAAGRRSSGAAGAASPVKVGFVYIGSINDEGYTQAHDRGRLAVQQLGVETLYVENVGENSDCETAIRNLIDQGCNVIYTTSFGFMDWTIKVAQDFPNVKFAHCSGYKRADNVSTYFGKIYQARYLSGIAAGYKTRVNRIGYVAAFPIPEVIRGINAFTLGVQQVNPDVSVEVVWTNTWYDPALEKQAAIELLNRGVDVIAQHQDTTSPQIAAQEQGAAAVGYNVPTPNAAPQAYLTAPLFHWDTFYVDDVKHALAGDWTSRAYWEGFSNGTVSLDTLTANNDPRAPAAIAEAEAKIKSGSFDPFTGPLTDQSGVVRVPAGTRMTDLEIWNMDWFVKGVVGVIPQ